MFLVADLMQCNNICQKVDCFELYFLQGHWLTLGVALWSSLLSANFSSDVKENLDMDGSSWGAAGLQLNKLKVFSRLPAAQSQIMTKRERQQRSDVSTVDLLPLRRY